MEPPRSDSYIPRYSICAKVTCFTVWGFVGPWPAVLLPELMHAWKGHNTYIDTYGTCPMKSQQIYRSVHGLHPGTSCVCDQGGAREGHGSWEPDNRTDKTSHWTDHAVSYWPWYKGCTGVHMDTETFLKITTKECSWTSIMRYKSWWTTKIQTQILFRQMLKMKNDKWFKYLTLCGTILNSDCYMSE